MKTQTSQKLTTMICFVVVSCAVTGYFVGLQSPMNPAQRAVVANQPKHSVNASSESLDGVLLATSYADMRNATSALAETSRTKLADLKSAIDPLAEVTITPQQKTLALKLRASNRSFNGAPPTVPHPVDQMSSLTCAACHTNGFQSASLNISKMSHQFLTDCNQCHVESHSQHMAATAFDETTFVGMSSPTAAPRAYDGAPPMIPHSTWMRMDCMSCHGPTGKHGIRSTHPWRQNCQQCHAPSATLEQTLLDPQPKFLPPISVVK